MTWIRTRDWHVLTAGLLTYTADARFRVKHAAEASEWTLEIKYLQKKDDGTYYCQVSRATVTSYKATASRVSQHLNLSAGVRSNVVLNIHEIT